MATVSVHALSAGSLTLPERFFVTPADPAVGHSVPSLSFLIQHKDSSANVTRILFDLGLRRDLGLYPSPVQKHCESRRPLTTRPDVVASLAAGGLVVGDIDLVIFSHIHFDHVGMPREFTHPTQFLVGPGSLDLLSGKLSLDIGSHNAFEPDLLPLDRTVELHSPLQSLSTKLPSTELDGADGSPGASKSFLWNRPLVWTPFDRFPHTIDLFGDGTVLIVNAPGHLPGHINLLCRVASTKYVYLAGDSCHDVRLLTGEKDIAMWTDDRGKSCCIHADIPRTKETLARIREVRTNGLRMEKDELDGEEQVAEVELVFAHDWMWEEDANRRGRFWPGSL
ncbi:hypothetical protein A1O1_08605 [Capronia coronata CBS 617.96]|uniref:Uncharacterized protein n=1 Tax=Capronia coronata CBS 617.96 TaxID=1182541 RepID=W9XT01_9EURO|nr:uncharacterized protein A1O1_08605 [Capronia coronata CBS 617.96]EXJ80460.1 hypothetical protein A1O1_08605 [Capronia coronata CBS 617.96]